MNSKIIEKFEIYLLESLEDKSLAEPLFTRMSAVNKLMVSSDFSASEIPDGFTSASYFQARINSIFDLVRDTDHQAISNIPHRDLSGTPITLISMYLAIFNPIDSYSLSSELSRIKLSSLNYLYLRIFEKLSTEILFGKNAESDNGYMTQKSEVSDAIFYTLLDIAHESLDLEPFLKFLNEFIRIYVETEFRDDSRIIIEIFLKSLDYCVENAEYPIEWLLTQAFFSPVCISKEIYKGKVL